MSWKWLPNAVTVSRFPLSILIFILALHARWIEAGAVSVLVVVLDSVDGWLAVKLNAISMFGILADPIVDFVFSIALVAGAFFTEVVGWVMIGHLFLLFLFTWLPVVLTRPRSYANKVALAINRTYYASVIVGFTATYFYIPMGLSALWLLLPAVPVAYWCIKVSVSHH